MDGYWKQYGKRSRDFIEGVIAGVTALAVWKDGKQTVGCLGLPLEDEIEQIKEQLGWKED